MSAAGNGKQQHRDETHAAATRSGLNTRRGCEKTRPTMSSEAGDGWRTVCPWKIAVVAGVAVASAAVLIGGCSEDSPRQTTGGTLAGQVVVSGPLRNATISVDQLDLSVKSSVAIRAHVAALADGPWLLVM